MLVIRHRSSFLALMLDFPSSLKSYGSIAYGPPTKALRTENNRKPVVIFEFKHFMFFPSVGRKATSRRKGKERKRHKMDDKGELIVDDA